MSPAFVGETLEAQTWVTHARQARSLRRHEFLRAADCRLIARGETDWGFVDAQTGRPLAITFAIYGHHFRQVCKLHIL